jgi:hypothetical protein
VAVTAVVAVAAAAAAAAARSGGGGTENRGLHVLLPLFLITLVRDWVVIRELSCNVVLCRQFWWFKVCMWVEAGAYTSSHFTST